MLEFKFGLNREIHYGAYVGYGARGIWNGYSLDIPHDRQCVVLDGRANVDQEDKYKFLDYLNEHFNRGLMEQKARELVPACNSEEAPVVELFCDDRLVVKASTNNSGGYLYIAAYFHTTEEGIPVERWSPEEEADAAEWQRDHDYARRIEL